MGRSRLPTAIDVSCQQTQAGRQQELAPTAIERYIFTTSTLTFFFRLPFLKIKMAVPVLFFAVKVLKHENQLSPHRTSSLQDVRKKYPLQCRNHAVLRGKPLAFDLITLLSRNNGSDSVKSQRLEHRFLWRRTASLTTPISSGM